MKRRRNSAARVFDFIETYPGSTIMDVFHELGGCKVAIGRIVRRMRAAELLTVTMVDDEPDARYAVTPGAQPPSDRYPRKVKKRRATPTESDRVRLRAQKRESDARRRAKARAERRCQRCLAGLLDDWKFAKCPECLEKGRLDSLKYMKTERGKASRKRNSALYNERNGDRKRARMKADSLRRKLNGQCQRCSLSVIDGSQFCAAHLERVRRWQRESLQRRKERLTHDDAVSVSQVSGVRPVDAGQVRRVVHDAQHDA